MNFSFNDTVEKIPEALSIFVNQIVYDKKNRGERVYTFSLGEAYFNIPKFDISDDNFSEGYHYSSSMGERKLRERIAEMYSTHYNVYADANTEIIVSAGSKIIIFMLLQALLNKDDDVVVYEPAWLSYKEHIRLNEGRYVPIPYYVPVRDWEKYITDKTKVLIINNPNNPSGKLYTEEELRYLLGLAEKYDFFILSDEAYSDFLLADDTFVSLATIDKEKRHCLVVNSLSKNMGMSGWRVGYAIAHEEIIKRLLKLNQHLITCAPTLLQNYMADHFHDILSHTIPQARAMAEKRKEVQKLLDRLSIKHLAGVGTFYFLLDVSDFVGTTDELVYDLLINHNIATVPGAAYGESTRDFIRFGIGVESLDDIEMCLRKIKSFLDMDKYENETIHKQMARYGIDCRKNEL